MNGDVFPSLGATLSVRDTAGMGLAAALQQLHGRAEESVAAEKLAEDNSAELVGISIGFAVLTTLLLAVRSYAKRFQAGGIFADEVFLVLAWIVNMGMCALGVVMTKVGGVGRHIVWLEANDPSKIVGWAQCIFAFEIIYFVSVALPKMAIICLYLRMFNWRGGMRTFAWIVFILVTATSVSLVVAACFQCRPIAYWWDKTIEGGVCFDVQAFFHAQAIPGFILDLVIMAMPVETIWNLKLPTYKRLALVGVFLIASFGIVASIIRATVFFGTAAFGDSTWASVDLIGWSIIETSVYIITGCLPHLKPVISHYTPGWLKRAIKSTVGSLPTKMGSSKGRSGIKSYGHGTSKSRSTRRDQKSQLGGQSTVSPDDDSIELTSHNTLKGAVSVSSMSNQSDGLHSPGNDVWPPTSYQMNGPDNDMSPRVDIRSSSLEYDQNQESPPQTAGQITVTREIKMTRE